MITQETYEMNAEVQPNEVLTYHVLEPDYSFIFGTKFDTDGDVKFQQFEKDGERVLVDPNEPTVTLNA